jgi:hypothetical protein
MKQKERGASRVRFEFATYVTHGRYSHDFGHSAMTEESPMLLRLLASRCRSIATSSTDLDVMEVLEEMARELEERAEELGLGNVGPH